MQIRDGIAEAIGNTPLVKLKRASDRTGCTILGKAEFMNPGQSVKDRAALFIIEDAVKSGRLRRGGMCGRKPDPRHNPNHYSVDSAHARELPTARAGRPHGGAAPSIACQIKRMVGQVHESAAAAAARAKCGALRGKTWARLGLNEWRLGCPTGRKDRAG